MQRQAKGFFQRMSHWLDGGKMQDLQSLESRSPIYSRNRMAVYDDYYYDDDYDRKGFHKDSYGALSGHGDYCYEDQISIGLLITSIAGIALMWYVLWTKIQASGGRRRRDLSTWMESLLNFLSDFNQSKQFFSPKSSLKMKFTANCRPIVDQT